MLKIVGMLLIGLGYMGPFKYVKFRMCDFDLKLSERRDRNSFIIAVTSTEDLKIDDGM